jgi:hypothetical protein
VAIAATGRIVGVVPVVATVLIAPAPTVPTAVVREADARYNLTNLAMTRPATAIPTVRSTIAINV